MTTESASEQKYHRGENPRSLANLNPWTAETRPEPTPRGPLITPALKRLLAMPMHELRDMLDKAKVGDVPEDLTVAEGVALVMLKKALDQKYGDKTREQVLDRVDGKQGAMAALEVEATKDGILVRYVHGAEPE